MKTATTKRGIVWLVTEADTLPFPCRFCGVQAIVALPPHLLTIQPDDTTHVCHPGLGGCNHGFAIDGKS